MIEVTEQCPEREHCLSLKGAPIGMYHCNHCGQMLLAGMDPTGLCPEITQKRNAESRGEKHE